MNSLLNAAVGPFSLVQLFIVGACLIVDIRRALAWHLYATAGDPPPRTARVLGRRSGAWTRALLTAGFGIGVLLGSRAALAGLTVTLVAGSLLPARDFAEGLLARLTRSGQPRSPVAIATISVSYIALTRGVPVALLYASSIAA